MPSNKIVQVSDGSRAMARPCGHEVTSVRDEHRELIRQKIELEQKLSAYSDTAFLKEQKRIRSKGGNTLSAWIDRKCEMEQERQAIIHEKALIETRISAIKDVAKQEGNELARRNDPTYRLWLAMLEELKSINNSLKCLGK